MSFLYSLLLEFYNELFHDVCLFSIYCGARLVHLPYLKQLIFNTIIQYNQLNTSKSRKDKLHYSINLLTLTYPVSKTVFVSFRDSNGTMDKNREP